MSQNHKKKPSSARQDRRKKARAINKKFEFVRYLDIDDEYTKIVLGLSELDDSHKKTFLEYIRVRMPLDKKFQQHMLELNHTIAVETKKKLELENKEVSDSNEPEISTVNESPDNS